MHLCIILALTLTLPSFIMLGTSSIGYELIQLIYHFILCLTLTCFSVFIIKKQDEGKTTTTVFLFITLFLITAGIFLLHDAILMKAGKALVSDEKISEWILRNNKLRDFIPLYKRATILAIHSAAFSALIFYIIKSESDKVKKSIILTELSKTKNENLETQLQLLKQQISPHFLFNSLNTLRCIATDNNTKSYITQLSNVYRYLLTNNKYKDEDLVFLKDELEFTNSYLYILKERFEDALDINININDETLYTQIPPLALQVLIENATKHNVISMDSPLCINIYNEGDDKLVVSNNLQAKLSSEDSLGIGLDNIKKRYQLLSDKEIEIIKTEKDFTVKLPLIKRVTND
ncbi:MAG: histidine kinase [Paludibacteraceae bacterium]|nr:histidine kinase [Paludibacteraceae bacterium]MBP5136701.1 histidine kinase [Paludibacteraceae bacterium]